METPDPHPMPYEPELLLLERTRIAEERELRDETPDPPAAQPS
jgi:hypothetical protein